jgi:hypothetical protein
VEGPLHLVPTDLLVAEIEARCEACVIAYERPCRGGRRGASFHYHGGVSACIGLLERFKHDLLVGDAVEPMPEGGERE